MASTEGSRKRLMFLIYTDVDGVLTTGQKSWYKNNDGKLQNTKTYSDRDTVPILLLGDQLIWISHDKKVNEDLAVYRKVKFEWVPEGESKLERIRGLTGEQPYTYIGDSLQDMECLCAAEHAYVPANASPILEYALDHRGAVHRKLKTKGGEGVLEEVLLDLHRRRVINLNTMIVNKYGFRIDNRVADDDEVQGDTS